MFHYFDSAATTPVCPEAAQAALEAMTRGWGNPSSVYEFGRQAAQALTLWRADVAGALGCAPGELFFTSCGTESDNWAIRSALALNRRVGRHIVTTAIEHAAVLEPCRALEREGYEVTYLQPDRQGNIAPGQVEEAIRPDTALVTMMLVNNELGTLQPVSEAVKAVKAYDQDILFHTDAVQALLKVPFSPAALGVDLLTVSGHKVRAPKGIGAQYVRRGLRLSPLLLGGGQEGGWRPGTEPTAQIAAFAAALHAWQPEWAEQIRAVKDHALTVLSEVSGLQIISAGDAPHICAVSLPGYPAEMLLRSLSDQGVCVSSGSACHRGKPSHVFASLGLPKNTLMGMLRISFGPENTCEDAEVLRDALIKITGERVSRS